MFANTLDDKPLFTRPDGIEIKDLTQSIFDLKTNNFIEYEAYRVPKEYSMRPDLISKAVYNNSQYTEIILKYNGISNPFSINEGDIILIPNLDSAREKMKISGTGVGADPADELRKSYKYIDPLKSPKKDQANKNFDDRQLIDVKDGALPPNLAEEGTSQITYRDGRVYFGEGTETCLKSGMSQGEFLTSIIKNKNKT